MEKSLAEYAKEIEELKVKNENTVKELDEQASILYDKSIEFLKSRIKYEIDSCVKNHPEHTKELAESNQLKDMKDEMNQLLEEIPHHVSIVMDSDKVFIHRSIKPDRSRVAYEYKNIIRKKYTEAYQIVIGFAGEILNRNGYIKVRSAYDSSAQWQYISGSREKIKFGYGIDMREIEEDWKKYTDLVMIYHDDLLKCQSLIKNKEETEAMNLWESI